MDSNVIEYHSARFRSEIRYSTVQGINNRTRGAVAIGLLFIARPYPAMQPTGAVQDTAECYVCRVNGSGAVLPIGKTLLSIHRAFSILRPSATSACSNPGACRKVAGKLVH